MTEVKQKKPNSWILFLKSYASENNVSYSSLIGDPKIKELYMASKTPVATPASETTKVVEVEVVKKVKRVKVDKPKEKKEKKEKTEKVDKPKKEDLVAEVVV